MTDALRAGKQVLLVARDDGFLEEATRLLGDHEVVRADSIAQARDLMAGGDVDIVLLGPSFGYEEAVVEAGTLVAADPSALVVLVANLSTNRMLTAAIRAGLADLVNTPLTDRKIAEVMSRTDHSESPEVPPETDLEVPEEVVEAAEGPAEAETPFELDEEQSWTTSPDAVETLEPRAPEIEAEPEEDGAADTDPALIWNSQPSAETLWTAVEAPAAPDQVDSDALPWLADTQEAVLEVDRVAAPTEPEGPFEELDESADYEFADYDPFAPMEPAAGLDIAVEEAVEEAQPAEPDLFAPIEPAAEPDIAVEEAVEEAQPAATLEPDVATPPSLYSSLTELEEDSDLDLHLPEVPPETDLEVPEPAAPEPPVVEEVAEEEAPKAGKGRSGTNLKEKMEEVHDIFASLAPVREETRAPDSFWERLLTAKLETTEAETQAETEAETDAQIEAETGDPYVATRVERVTPKKLRHATGRTIVVISGKGGSGRTVIATNVAVALASQLKPDSVAIVDADLQFGDVSLLLQLDPLSSIVDASAQVDDLNEARLDALLLHHESGLRVLPAPLLPVSPETVDPKAVVRVLQMLQRMFQFVVVDTAPVFGEPLLTILDHADDVLLVVDMDVPSVKNSKIAIDALRTSQYPMGKVKLLVNRANSKARLDVGELERSLRLPIMASVPSDKLVPQSVNEGIPVVSLRPTSKVAKSFHSVVELFVPQREKRHKRRFGLFRKGPRDK